MRSAPVLVLLVLAVGCHRPEPTLAHGKPIGDWVAALRDPESAAELDQEFALRFIRGDFHRADPSRGRFRDFVKQALRNLMIDYLRRQKLRPRQLGDDLPEPAEPAAKVRARRHCRPATSPWPFPASPAW